MNHAEIWLKTSTEAEDIRETLQNFRELIRAESTIPERQQAEILRHMLSKLPHTTN